MLTTVKQSAFKLKRFFDKKRKSYLPTDSFQFPPEFDANIYKKLYRDLTLYNPNDLYKHYLTHGIEKGRRANNLKTRLDFIDLISQGKKIL